MGLWPPLMVLFWLWLNAIDAQTPAYINYAVRDGLPGNNVYCGIQDSRGLLWFGTDKGLACFDGMRFRTYGIEDGLPDLEVLNMQEDSQGRLWLSCFRKKPCYMFQGRIYSEKQDSLLAKMDLNTGVYNIYEDTSQGIWLTDFTKTAYKLNRNSVLRYDFPAQIGTFFTLDGIFMAMGESAVMRVTPGGEASVFHHIKAIGGGLPSVCLSGNRILYSAGCLRLFDCASGNIREITTVPDFSGRVFTDYSGRFWGCSTKAGAICFDNLQKDLSNPVVFLKGKKVTAMFEDSQGTMWFCTANEGVFALPRNTPVTYNGDKFQSNNIRSITGSKTGQILFGDDLGNVHIIEGDNIRTIALGAPDGYNQVRQILTTADGGFYAASDEGLFYCKNNTGPPVFFKHKLSLKSIWLQSDKIWFAEAGRLGYFQNPANLQTDVILRRFTTVSGDHDNHVWAGGMGGLYSQSDSFKTNWGNLFPALNSRITSIQRAGKNELWVVTQQSGLLSVSVREGKVIAVDEVNKRLKKPIRNIQSIFTESNGRTWMATNHGIYGLSRNGQIIHFDTHDGLADNDVNAVYARNDTLWAGTAAGLTRITLQPPDENGDFTTFITALLYQDHSNQTVTLHLLDSLPHRHFVDLPPEATVPELELAGLDYRSRGNLYFEIMQSNLLLPVQWWTLDNLVSYLSGSLQGIKQTFRAESATYNLGTYLPPGRYLFEVTAIEASGIRSRHSDIWTLTKHPNWYETIWIYLLLWGALAYGIWRIYKARRAFQNLHATASVMQLQALQAQMNPHFIGNAINAIQQFLHPPDPIKTSEYISIFMRLLRRTMFFSEKTFISFGEELAYDQEYLQLIKLRFEERVQIEVSGETTIPADTPIPGMLLQPLLENATIHGLAPEGSSMILLKFSLEGKQFQCDLIDNGIGIKESQRLRQQSGLKRESKGLEVLRRKIDTLNRLYRLDLTLVIRDLSEADAGRHGTHITISYSPEKIWTVLKK